MLDRTTFLDPRKTEDPGKGMLARVADSKQVDQRDVVAGKMHVRNGTMHG